MNDQSHYFESGSADESRLRGCLFLLHLALGNQGECNSGIGMQLLHDPADIVFDRTLGQEHGIGDLPVAHALGNELQYFLLLVVEDFRMNVAAGRRRGLYGRGGH